MLSAREITLIGRDIEAKGRGAHRHDAEAIVRVVTYLQFRTITQATISELTEVSRSIIKKTATGRLHKRVKPSRKLAEAIMAQWRLARPATWDRIDQWGP